MIDNYEEREGGRGKLDAGQVGEVYMGGLRSNKEETPYRDRKAWSSKLIFENLTWLTSSEAAEYLRLPSVGALRFMVFERKIPFYKMGRNLRFKKSELDRFMDLSKKGGF